MSQEGKMMKSVECGTNTLCRLHVAHKTYIHLSLVHPRVSSIYVFIIQFLILK